LSERTFHSYIGGEIVIGGETLPVENPATEQPCASFTVYTPEMLDRALEQARDAFAVWSRTPMHVRVAWMTRLAEALEKPDWEKAHRMAHSIKGAARTVGALRAGAIAEQMEYLCKQKDAATAGKELKVLEADVDNALDYLSRKLKKV